MLFTHAIVNGTTIIVAAFRGTGVLTSQTSTVTSPAAAVGNTWSPTTAVPSISPPSLSGIEVQPATTSRPCCVPRAPNATGRDRSLTMRASMTRTVTIRETTTVTQTNTVACVCFPKPAAPTGEPVSRLATSHNQTHYMNEIALGLRRIVSAHSNESMADWQEDNTIHGGGGIFDPARTNDRVAPLLADMSVMGLPGGNTPSDYILVVVVRTLPGKAASEIDRWLSRLYALAMLVVVCNVGKFIYVKFQERRGRGRGHGRRDD